MAFLIIVAAMFAVLIGLAAFFDGQYLHAALLLGCGLAISVTGFDAFG